MTVEARPMGVACNIQCTYCLAEGTPVLMANGTWKPIELVLIGDEIVGFDEFSEGKNKQRIYKKAIVTATPSRMIDGVKIITDKGEVSCSLDHMWLNNYGEWKETRDFEIGQHIRFVSSTDDLFGNPMEGYATIQEIIPIKEQQMYDLTTTTSTFVAGGFASHNCYQEPIRDAQNINTLYDIDKMIAELDKVGQEFNLFGGEALLVPLEDLERFWKYGFEKHGRNGLQTNGTLITDEHIKLFKKYNVSVGVSVDGANELNDLRKVGNIEKTREHTQKTMDNILKMVKNGIGVGVIITVHNYNATEDKLPRLKNFIRWLGDIGVKGGNLHLLEVDNEMVAKQLCLPPERELEVFLDLAKFFEEESNKDLRWQPFCDMPDMLKGEEDGTTCYWHRCDPLNTQSVYGIEGDGQLSNCGRTNKEGIDWYKADDFGYERYISLYYSPDEIGGCKGCRFWSICGGSCVGESQLGDMRNKTTHCSTMKGLLTYYEDKLEEEGIIPLSKHHLLEEAEKVILDNLVVGNNLVLSKAIKIAEEKYSDLKDQVGVSVYKEGVKVL